MTTCLLALLAYVVLFWVIVCGGYVVNHRSFSILLRKITPRGEDKEARDTREADEKKKIKIDVEDKIKIFRLRTRDKRETTEPKQLLDLGVALNHTLDREDAYNEARGEHWLSARRPLWFGIIQYFLAAMFIPVFAALLKVAKLLIEFSTDIFDTPTIPMWVIEEIPYEAAFLSFVTATVILGLNCYRIVPERWRMGVTRFGVYINILDSGLNFLLPFIESGSERPFPLTNFIWGPGEEAEGEVEENAPTEAQTDIMHLPGARGGKSNPTPGVIVVTMARRYDLTLRIKVMLRVRRSSPEDWYRFLFDFSSTDEIGEQIADVVETVASTMIREVEAEEEDVKKPEPDKIAHLLREFMDQIPEIAGSILLSLYEVSRERLGGMLPVSVSVLNPDPDETYQEQLRKLDSAQIKRQTDDLAGQGTAKRWQNTAEPLIKYLQTLTTEQQDVVRELIGRDVQLEVASKPSGVDALVSAIALGRVDRAAKNPTTAAATTAAAKTK